MNRVFAGILGAMAIFSVRSGLVYFARSQHYGHGGPYALGRLAGTIMLAFLLLAGIRRLTRD